VPSFSLSSVNFLIIFLLLGALAWRPMTRMLDERATRIARGLEDADVAAKARANAEAEAAQIIDEARREAAVLADEARGRGEEAAGTVLAEAREKADALLAEARELGVEVSLNSVVLGIYENRAMNVMIGDRIEQVLAQKTLVATGASENMIPFPGWTLPGVIGAGAAQTMANIHGIRPGNDILMIGSGNVGVIVSYQMLQAGCRVAAVIDAAPRIGAYAVHAAKIARVGVPFLMSHTIKVAHGRDRVEGATVVQVDDAWKPVAGTEKRFEVDTICIAVGLNPMTQLLRMAGCRMAYVPALGGRIPAHDMNMETSIEGIYVAGDISGIEEASTAIIEGRIAGLAAAHSLGYLDKKSFLEQRGRQYKSIQGLRSGSHGERRGKQQDRRPDLPLPQRLPDREPKQRRDRPHQ
jgi:ATP synthase F0 subunit b